VGCGAVSEILYAPAIKRLVNEGRIGEVVLVDRSEERIEKSRRLLPHASGRADLSTILDEVDTSLVIVALPHNLHAPVTIKALHAGAHVLCEKPMARTVQECDLMLEAEAVSSRLIAVGHFRRFFPVTNLIRQWIRAERLGRLRSFRFLEGEIYSWPAASASFFSRETAGGGVLIDAGAHTLDLLLWWMGPVGELHYSDDAAGGVEANCVIKLETESGVSGYVQMSRDWPLSNQYHLEFENGWLLYTYDMVDSFQWGWHGDSVAQRVMIEDGSKVGFDRLPKSGRVEVTFRRCFELQLLNVLEAMQGQASLVCPGSDARQTVALIERCYVGRQVLRQPWLSGKEQLKLNAFV
jgi:predicted dehydrogenase